MQTSSLFCERAAVWCSPCMCVTISATEDGMWKGTLAVNLTRSGSTFQDGLGAWWTDGLDGSDGSAFKCNFLLKWLSFVGSLHLGISIRLLASFITHLGPCTNGWLTGRGTELPQMSIFIGEVAWIMTKMGWTGQDLWPESVTQPVRPVRPVLQSQP